MRSVRAAPLLGIALLALAWAPNAHAEEFPDLPGMGAAARVVAGQEAPPGEPAQEQQTSFVQTSVGDGASSESVRSLPGMGAAPVVHDAEAARVSTPLRSRGPVRGLEVWAALGTLAALGGFVLLRRLDVL